MNTIPTSATIDPAGYEMFVAKASSFISGYGYRRSDRGLRIEFKGGKIVDYAEVPENVFSDMMSAPSVGTFFHSDIKNRFPVLDGGTPKPTAPRRGFSQVITGSPDARTSPMGASVSDEQASPPQKDEQQLETTALTIVEKADQITIADQRTYDQAADVFETVLALEREIVGHYKPLKEAAHNSHKLICNAETKILAPVLVAKKTLSLNMGQYDAQQRLVKQAEERRLQVEQEALATADALEAAVEAEAAGATQEEVIHILQSPAPAPRITAPATYSKRFATTDEWHAYSALEKGVALNELQQLMLVVKAAMQNPEAYLPCLSLNMREINTRAKNQKGAFNVPGFIAQPIPKARGTRTNGGR
jgi:hypothetical protein